MKNFVKYIFLSILLSGALSTNAWFNNETFIEENGVSIIRELRDTYNEPYNRIIQQKVTIRTNTQVHATKRYKEHEYDQSDKWLLILCRDKTIRIIDLENLEQYIEEKHQTEQHIIEKHPTKKEIIVRSTNPCIKTMQIHPEAEIIKNNCNFGIRKQPSYGTHTPKWIIFATYSNRLLSDLFPDLLSCDLFYLDGSKITTIAIKNKKITCLDFQTRYPHDNRNLYFLFVEYADKEVDIFDTEKGGAAISTIKIKKITRRTAITHHLMIFRDTRIKPHILTSYYSRPADNVGDQFEFFDLSGEKLRTIRTKRKSVSSTQYGNCGNEFTIKYEDGDEETFQIRSLTSHRRIRYRYEELSGDETEIEEDTPSPPRKRPLTGRKRKRPRPRLEGLSGDETEEEHTPPRKRRKRNGN